MSQPYDWWHRAPNATLNPVFNDRFIGESAGVLGSGAVANGSEVPDVLWTKLFFVGDLGVKIARMSIFINGGGSPQNQARLGIYDVSPPSARDLYPKNLVYDFGVTPSWPLSAVSGPSLQSTADAPAGAVALTPGYYWMACVLSGVAGNVTAEYRMSGANCPLGVDPSTFVPYIGFRTPHVFGALPATFPAGATPFTAIAANNVYALRISMQREAP